MMAGPGVLTPSKLTSGPYGASMVMCVYLAIYCWPAVLPAVLPLVLMTAADIYGIYRAVKV